MSRPPTRLLISDIDGTLVTPDKVLTSASLEAARDLARAGIGLSLISSRPPRGMAHVARALELKLPFAAFNGGAMVSPEGRVGDTFPLSPKLASQAVTLLIEGGVDVWVFADDDWFLRDVEGVRVGRERRTVNFEPTVATDLAAVTGAVGKIVGVSDDYDRLDRCEEAARLMLGEGAAVTRSQRYYLDISSPAATKGQGVTALCTVIGVDLAETTVIGDMNNDISMFDVAGHAIAMGQAPAAVKAHAGAVTTSNTEEGFANAVRMILAERS